MLTLQFNTFRHLSCKNSSISYNQINNDSDELIIVSSVFLTISCLRCTLFWKARLLFLVKISLAHAVPAWRIEVQNFSFKNLDNNHFKALTWCKTVFFLQSRFTLVWASSIWNRSILGTGTQFYGILGFKYQNI